MMDEHGLCLWRVIDNESLWGAGLSKKSQCIQEKLVILMSNLQGDSYIVDTNLGVLRPTPMGSCQMLKFGTQKTNFGLPNCFSPPTLQC